MSIGIPIKLIHEAEGHIITLETTTGEIYRGKLLEAEDNMNCQLQNVTVTQRNGQVSKVSRERSISVSNYYLGRRNFEVL